MAVALFIRNPLVSAQPVQSKTSLGPSHARAV